MDEAATPKTRTLAELVTALENARARFEDDDDAAKTASRSRTNSLTALNEAQKAFDAEVVRLRQGAPSESDWARNQGRRSTTWVCRTT